VVWSRPTLDAAAQLDVADRVISQPNSREVRLTMPAH
jgi:hypothetical protein